MVKKDILRWMICFTLINDLQELTLDLLQRRLNLQKLTLDLLQRTLNLQELTLDLLQRTLDLQ